MTLLRRLYIPLILIAILYSFSLNTLSAAYFSRVVIDAGHGDQDVGGNFQQVYEKHLALDTAMRVQHYLKRKGISTVMTRKSDRFISLPKRSSIGNKYRNSIFVSIHYNWAWNKSANGLETFYNNSRSKVLAKYIQSSMLREARASSRGVKYGSYAVLRKAKNPAVLVECGFISNRSERNRMMKGSWRQDIAEGIAKGILKYRKSRY